MKVAVSAAFRPPDTLEHEMGYLFYVLKVSLRGVMHGGYPSSSNRECCRAYFVVKAPEGAVGPCGYW